MNREFAQDVTGLPYSAALLERDPRDKAKDPYILRLFTLEEGFVRGPFSENDEYVRALFVREDVQFAGMSPVTPTVEAAMLLKL